MQAPCRRVVGGRGREKFLYVFKGGTLRSPPAAGYGRPQAAVLAGRQSAARHRLKVEENNPPEFSAASSIRYT